MQRLQFPNRGKFNPDDWPRFVVAVENALLKYEYDSGWISRPTSNSVPHTMGNLPGFVQVMESDTRTGEPFNQILASSVSRTQIAFSSASKSFVRVIASF